MASLGLVSPLFFPEKNWRFFTHHRLPFPVLRCHPDLFSPEKLTTFFLLITHCHFYWFHSSAVRPRLCIYPHNFFSFGCHPLEDVTGGGPPPFIRPPSDATGVSYTILNIRWWVKVNKTRKNTDKTMCSRTMNGTIQTFQTIYRGRLCNNNITECNSCCFFLQVSIQRRIKCFKMLWLFCCIDDRSWAKCAYVTALYNIHVNTFSLCFIFVTFLRFYLFYCAALHWMQGGLIDWLSKA